MICLSPPMAPQTIKNTPNIMQNWKSTTKNNQLYSLQQILFNPSLT